jgi:drug/metabolite transporter (DMT)-like permease
MHRATAFDFGLLSGVGLIWGSQFLFNSLAIETYSPLTVATGRVVIGFLTLSLAVLLLPKLAVISSAKSAKQPWGLYCVLAIVEAVLPCFLIPWGQQGVDSSIAAILLATVPIFTLLLAPMIVKSERWNLAAAIRVAVGFAGVMVLLVPTIQGSWTDEMAGELAILGGALSFSIGLILMKRITGVPAIVAMRNIFMIGSVPLLAITLITERPWEAGFVLSSALAVVALGILVGGIAYALFFYMVHRAGPTFTSLVNYLVTLFGVFLGIAVLGDQLHTTDIVAMVLIVAALGYGSFRWGNRRNADRS